MEGSRESVREYIRWGVLRTGGEQVGRDIDSKKGNDNKMILSLISYGVRGSQ